MSKKHLDENRKLTQISNKEAETKGYYHMITSTVPPKLIRNMVFSAMAVDVLLGLLAVAAQPGAAEPIPVDTISISLMRPAWGQGSVKQVIEELGVNGLVRYTQGAGRKCLDVVQYRKVFGGRLGYRERDTRDRCDGLLRSLPKRTRTGILAVFHTWNSKVLSVQSSWQNEESIHMSTEAIAAIRKSLGKRGVKSVCTAIEKHARKLTASSPNADLSPDLVKFLDQQ